MQFSKDSTVFLKYLLPRFKKFYSTDRNSNSVEALSSVYHDLVAGEKYYETIKNTVDVKLMDASNIKNPESINSNQYSSKVSDYIKKHEKSQLVFNFNIFDREIAVYFTLFASDDVNNIQKYKKYIRLIIMWLFMCNKYSTSNCSNTLAIFFYLTPLPKLLPNHKNNIIGYENINTGMTYRCAPNNEIFIYRHEEWFKVFIHETFHSYGLDIDTHDTNIIKRIVGEIFPIKSMFDIMEAYTETWARILNCCFFSYETMTTETIDEFKLYLRFTIQTEKMFSLYQLKKVLGHMDLTYENLWSPSRISEYMRMNLYREESNVFCYFVLTGIFMNDFEGFIDWCNDNNTAFIKFKKSHNNASKFGHLIQSIYKSKSFIQNLANIPDLNTKNKNYQIMNKTGRMTCIEIGI
jgi:hypothetical protein